MTCEIPFAWFSPTAQLIECNGKVHLYRWEMSRERLCMHSIDVLECPNLNESARAWQWRNVVRVTDRCGYRVYTGRGWTLVNEYSCVNFGDGKLCVFNMMSRNGVVYDMRNGKQVSVLVAPSGNEKGEKFFTWNPASYSLQPCFDSDPM
ncbi:hypothetical protein M758_10G096200 [Ceratodon purpureus]|nr:hypothetical protein M758_10G096200 [Ceratodon purpureus]